MCLLMMVNVLITHTNCLEDITFTDTTLKEGAKCCMVVNSVCYDLVYQANWKVWKMENQKIGARSYL